jgi:palmitoyltransferase ZDHHC4
MGTPSNVLIVVCLISFFIFIVIFGRLPGLRSVYVLPRRDARELLTSYRRTPIGFIDRLIWIHIPHILSQLDRRFTKGRITRSASPLGQYLVYKKHPIVLVCHPPLITHETKLPTKPH